MRSVNSRSAVRGSQSGGLSREREHARRAAQATRSGAFLLAVAVALVALILFVGLVIDVGLAYSRRAELSKAVDAAALAGIGNLSGGAASAEQVSRAVFAANYPTGKLDLVPPQVEVQIGFDADGNRTIDVSARAHSRTLFLRILPQFSTIDVAADSQAKRAKLLLSLALDRSGSMLQNGGCSALPPAVDAFIGYFDDTLDWVSLSTYASNATLDVPLSSPFQAAVTANIPRQCSDYFGFTFLQGGLELARLQNEGASASTSADAVKVLVLFTDGLANTLQDDFTCPPKARYNLTSGDSGNQVTLLNPLNGQELCRSWNGGPLSCCPALVAFPSIKGGLCQAVGPNAGFQIRQEAKARALATAKAARLRGNVIFAVGLGSNLDQAFLKELANDPSSPAFVPTEPVGAFAHSPTAAQLKDVFIQIAKSISMRITR